jgi:4-alpha-glucanotransferase
MERSSGVFLHITSLESPHGIGTLGECAYRFADFLKRAGQSYWQILPLGVTGYGDSPYQPYSSFAGNPLLIDLDMLVEEGLLAPADLETLPPVRDAASVDYDAVRDSRKQLLLTAYRRSGTTVRRAVQAFAAEQADWLSDYSLYMALKERYGGGSWQDWPEPVRLRQRKALEDAARELADEAGFHDFLQYLFFRQLHALKTYVNDLGIRLIGDLPIYSSEDSADVWAHPELFALNEDLRASHISGVPPDYFSPDGQLWGNPLYNWPAHKATKYEWWMKRIGALRRCADVVRIDHFRGFWNYWCVPAGAATAKEGTWRFGPGMDFVRAIQSAFPDFPVIAEDLGLLSAGARSFVRDSGYPGMNVLQFSFNATRPASGAPHTFSENSVCYTGTHDNTTSLAWYKEISNADRAHAKRYMGLNEEEGPVRGLIRSGMASASRLFIAPMQDWLELDAEARMNTPGTVGCNWQWRMLPGQRSGQLAADIRRVTRTFGRIPKARRRKR